MPWDLTTVFMPIAQMTFEPNVFISRFEDLVGENKKLQRRLLEELAIFLGLEYSDEVMTEIQEGLFGTKNMGTRLFIFHEGKTGQWKKMFNEEHKKIFKERAGEALIFFGYEKDNNW